MRRLTSPSRRSVLAGLPLAFMQTGVAVDESQPRTLVIAGPVGGRLDHWAAVLARTIGQGLPSRIPLGYKNVGGIDGVTGANQFDARGEPDGTVALLVPGTATLTWLTGETRAHFDPALWIPLWASVTNAVLVSNAALVPGTRLRVASSGPVGAELPCLLALDLLGVVATPVSPRDAQAVLLHGPGAKAMLAARSRDGFQPVMTLGLPGPEGFNQRDPAMPGIPTAYDLVRDKASSDLMTALLVAAAAVQLEAGLVLPALTPAAAVSQWRQACLHLGENAAIGATAAQLGTKLLSQEKLSACMAGIEGKPSVLLALRQWLATRYDWSPT